jgi:hypothetical protein
MSCYVRKVGGLALSSLKLSKDELVSSISPPIKLHGLVGIPAGLVILSFATLAWLSVFLLAPMLLTFVWAVLQPYRLWVFLKSRMTGTNFSG